MKSRLLLSSLLLILILSLAPKVCEAKVYTAYRYYEEWYFGIRFLWELWVTINTTAQTWWVRWSGPTFRAIVPYLSLGSYLWRWDDKGFVHKYGPFCIPGLAPSGEWTIPYNNTETWTYTEFMWQYQIDPFLYWPVILRIGLYVGDLGNNPVSRGGGSVTAVRMAY